MENMMPIFAPQNGFFWTFPCFITKKIYKPVIDTVGVTTHILTWGTHYSRTSTVFGVIFFQKLAWCVPKMGLYLKMGEDWWEK